MVPMQVWLPTLQAGLGMPEVARDAQRAYGTWSGEGTVWLLPELTGPQRWERQLKHRMLPGAAELALPAEHLDRLDIFHIDEDGWVYGPGAYVRFPGGRVDGLLQAWLNAFQTGGVRVYECPQRVILKMPCITEDGIAYEDVPIRFQPDSFLPVAGLEQDLQILPVLGRTRQGRGPHGEQQGQRLVWSR